MKYKENQEITYIPLNQRVVVEHVTPYHDADDQHATVTVRLRSGDLRTVPVAKQEKYLTTDPPKPRLRWLLGKTATR